MSKRLLVAFATLGLDPQCVEGMTWGPALLDGSRSLILLSDNNFGLVGKTAFHLLAVG
nr:esterase-like activity of phytase family protein [Nocardia inohanensis]